jgi:hypothetical protein
MLVLVKIIPQSPVWSSGEPQERPRAPAGMTPRGTSLLALVVLGSLAPAAQAAPSGARCAVVLQDSAGDSGVGPAQVGLPGDPDGYGDLTSASLRSTPQSVTVAVKVADVPTAGSVYDHLWSVAFTAREQRWAAVFERAENRGQRSIVSLRSAAVGPAASGGKGAGLYEQVAQGTGVLDNSHDELRMTFAASAFGRFGLPGDVSDAVATASAAQPGSALLEALWTDLDTGSREGSVRLRAC